MAKPARAKLLRLIVAAHAATQQIERRFQLGRTELQPAEQFLRRVLRALPWYVNPDVFGYRTSTDQFDDCADVVLKIDHQELRRQLSGGHRLEHCWWGFSMMVAEGVLKDYARGQVDYQGAVTAVRKCVLACDPFEMDPVSYVIEMASSITPKTLNRRRPPIPPWVQCVAVTIFRVLKAENPDQPFAPYVYAQWTSPILKATVDWLITFGVCDGKKPIPQHTIYRWYRAEEKKRSRIAV